MNIKMTEAGIVFGPDELHTAHGQMIAKLYDELCRARIEAEWWRKAALGVLWLEALDDDEDEPF